MLGFSEELGSHRLNVTGNRIGFRIILRIVLLNPGAVLATVILGIPSQAARGPYASVRQQSINKKWTAEIREDVANREVFDQHFAIDKSIEWVVPGEV